MKTDLIKASFIVAGLGIVKILRGPLHYPGCNGVGELFDKTEHRMMEK